MQIPLVLIGLAGAGLGALMGVPLLLGRGDAGRPRRLLGALLLVASAAVACISLEHGRFWRPDVWFEQVEFCLALVAGPLLYFFILSGLQPEVRFRNVDLLHGLPAAGCVVWALLSQVGLVQWDVPIHPILAHQMSYTMLAVRRYWMARTTRPPAWARVVLLVFLCMHLAQLARLTFRHRPELREVVPLTMTASFILLGQLSFHRAFGRTLHPVAFVAKYQKSSLSTEKAPEYLEQLNVLMRDRKPFRDPQLTLPALAKELSLPPYLLSQLLNQHVRQSFSDYLTAYRVEEAKRLLLDPLNQH